MPFPVQHLIVMLALAFKTFLFCLTTEEHNTADREMSHFATVHFLKILEISVGVVGLSSLPCATHIYFKGEDD